MEIGEQSHLALLGRTFSLCVLVFLASVGSYLLLSPLTLAIPYLPSQM